MDARHLFAGGIGRYVREIAASWMCDHRVDGVVLLGDPSVVRPWLATVEGRPDAVIAWTGGQYSVRAQLSWVLARTRVPPPDVWFFPHYDVPLVAFPRPSVVCVHDLIQYRQPGFARWKRALGWRLLSHAMQCADAVVTVSSHSGTALREAFPPVAEKIRVVPNGVAKIFSAVEPAGEEASWVAGLAPFLLTVGSDRPHKNLPFAVEVFAALRRERPSLRLIMVGVEGERRGGAIERAEHLGVRDDVVPLPFQDDRILRQLYSTCEALLFPSGMEGFGLPPREALASGATVVVSDVAGLRELSVSGATVLPTRGIDAWVTALRGARQESGDPPSFPGWSAAASQTLAVLHETLS